MTHDTTAAGPAPPAEPAADGSDDLRDRVVVELVAASDGEADRPFSLLGVSGGAAT